MSDLIAEYKAMLMNADSLDIVYLSAESTDLYPSDGAELVSLTGVNSVGDVVLNLRFDTVSCRTGSDYHGITKDQIAGLPRASDVLAELKHFLANDDGNERYCWSHWFITFFSELIDEKPKVTSVKDLGYSIGIDEYSTLYSTAFSLNVKANGISKEKLGFLVMEKVIKLAPLADELNQLRNKLAVLENNFRVVYNKVMFGGDKAPLDDDEKPTKITEGDIPF